MAKYKILISGGGGFIGSHLAERLITLGHRVLVVDDFSTGKMGNLLVGSYVATDDIIDYKFKEPVDYVFHLAALASVPASVKDPEKSRRINVLGTDRILHESLLAKVRKVIFSSSCAIYGDAQNATEETPPKPESPYAQHKLEAEHLMERYDKTLGLHTLCLRFFNVYGTRSDPDSPYSLVISKFIKLKKEGKKLPIYGDGTQTRDFVYVDDIVSACIKAMESKVHNEIINVCTQKSTSVNEIADIIGGEKTYLPKRKGDAEHISGINQKAQSLLDWQPKVNIKEGIRNLL